MTGNATAAGPGRLKLILIAIIFLGPLAVAGWLYFGDASWRPTGRTNHGQLIQPIVNLGERPGEQSLSELPAGAAEGQWLLIYADQAECLERCREALYRMRQSRLMLGNDMTRLTRLFLHGEWAPDTVWLRDEHAGLITIKNDGLFTVLDAIRPDGSAPGGLFLVDPLGNLVMYFAADLAPDEMVSDIEHLLELSRIG